ncbi:MAG TPA: winged helix-turn-helix domain-containing protein [Sphingobium sp.]|nr:winged helix-turn-helix domain-containing protein [Sphingobium sp.]
MTSVILISDDPLVIRSNQGLLHEQISTTHLTRREIASGLDIFQKTEIILLDIGGNLAAGLNDIAIIRRSYALALVLLAQGLTREERLQALAAGVTQILSSPPDQDELLLVLKNLIHLLPTPGLSLRRGDPEGDWLLDEARWCLRTPLGHDVQLQRAEAAILAKLFRQAGVNQSRQNLAASFKSDHEDKNRSLDVAISKIRKKVRDASNLDLPLRAVRGVGYVFIGRTRLVSDVARR